ncbi:MAG TPA: PilZ domain-containing protein [Candidatus Acidoferrales bacterium]|nr:PilZ domain-containing protein [Candidatus Acidoferrales bacterium]
MVEKRRCKRLPLNIPVRVYGRTPDDHPFRETTVTKYVNAHGALLPLAPQVKKGQEVTLVNAYTEEERQCRVVYVASKRGARNKRVALEFIRDGASRDGALSSPDFWHVFAPLMPVRAERREAS